MHLLAVEIGGSKLQLFTGTEDGRVLDRQTVRVDREGGGEGIRAHIKEIVTTLQPRFQWRAVGVGYGGPVDHETGRICKSYHVAGWSEFPLGDWMRELTGLPVVVENDTNVAAYGEAHRGAGVGATPVFYTNSGSGVGGGLVVNGKLYHGMKPGEAELGHIRLDREGTIVEDRCSGWAVDRRIRALVPTQPESVLSRLAADAPTVDARLLAPALAQGCTLARQILTDAATDLAFALSHATQLFHPEVIVLGGGVSMIGEPWRAAVATALPNFVMDAFVPGPPVRLAGLGEDAVPVGALLLAANRLPASA